MAAPKGAAIFLIYVKNNVGGGKFFSFHFSLFTILCTFAHDNRDDYLIIFIRLVVKIKVKVMLLDFQTTMMLVAVALATILSVITLMHTNLR